MDAPSLGARLHGAASQLADALGVARADAFTGRVHRFPSERGLLLVREESQFLPHLADTTVRARTEDGEEFDLRILRAGAAEGGFVTLAAVEAMEREPELMCRPTEHAHVVRCHASLTHNVGMLHCRLLLCDPCLGDLAAHTAQADRGELPAVEAAEVGQQLAFGLGHLHHAQILYGSIRPDGVLRGRDGFWKLGSYSCAVQMPTYPYQWRAQCLQGRGDGPAAQDLPPELQRAASDQTAVAAETDVWFLGHLLAAITEGQNCARDALPASMHMSAASLVVPPSSLLEPVRASLWVLLHWLLADSPTARPCVGGSAAMLGTLLHTAPAELLEEMPEASRARCLATATAAARELALNEAMAQSPGKANPRGRGELLDRLTNAPLEELRLVLDDPATVDRLCRNCGIEV